MRIRDWSSDVCSSDLVWAVRRRKQRPLATFHDPLHGQIRHPVGRVHVVRAATVVARVFAQLEEFLDVEVPGDRKSVVSGQSVSVRVYLGGCGMIKKKNNTHKEDTEVLILAVNI